MKYLPLIFFSSYTLSQSGRGRGYDDYDDYGGDGGFFYFLLAFWGFVLGVVLIRIIYETILENYKRWFKSFIESLIFFLKSLLGISMLFGVVFLGVYLFEKLDIKIPIYLEYVGTLILCLFWLYVIKYLFFDDKTNSEILAFFKKPLGMLIGAFITLIVIGIIFLEP